jgi:hypothetical protein
VGKPINNVHFEVPDFLKKCKIKTSTNFFFLEFSFNQTQIEGKNVERQQLHTHIMENVENAGNNFFWKTSNFSYNYNHTERKTHIFPFFLYRNEMVCY